MPNSWDVVVAGLGISGASVTYMLARRGARVLGLDLHTSPHTLGSSHGRSRVIRAAYFENPLYVPLALRSFELWAELEREANKSLFHQTGALMIGPEDGEVVQGTLASARTHSLEHEVLNAPGMQQRFPALTPHQSDVGILEHRAGMLAPEACITTLLGQAARHGAELRMRDPLLEWHTHDDLVVLGTPSGRIETANLIIAAGPWLPVLTRNDWPGDLLTVERQHVVFFDPRDHARIGPDACPITIWEHEPGRVFYTLPDTGDGLKAAIHHEGPATAPETVNRTVGDDEVETIRALLRRLIPAAEGPLREKLVCLYTNTPDRHFLIDTQFGTDNVFVISACSGHGFKFGPAIGEAVADWVITRDQPAALEPFCVRRFR